jgi:hypothetical protein
VLPVTVTFSADFSMLMTRDPFVPSTRLSKPGLRTALAIGRGRAAS